MISYFIIFITPVTIKFQNNFSPLFLMHCGIGNLKSKLLPDLKLSQNVLKHSLFKLCNSHEKINVRLFARGKNVKY